MFLLLKCNCDAQRRNRAGRRRGSGISDQTLALVPGDLGSVIVPTRRQSLLGTAMNVQALYASCGSTARHLALSQGAWEVAERPASSKNLNHQGPVWPPIAKSGRVWSGPAKSGHDNSFWVKFRQSSSRAGAFWCNLTRTTRCGSGLVLWCRVVLRFLCLQNTPLSSRVPGDGRSFSRSGGVRVETNTHCQERAGWRRLRSRPRGEPFEHTLGMCDVQCEGRHIRHDVPLGGQIVGSTS